MSDLRIALILSFLAAGLTLSLGSSSSPKTRGYTPPPPPTAASWTERARLVREQREADVKKGLTSSDAAHRLRALGTMGQYPDAKWLPTLERLSVQDPIPTVRQAALAALVRTPGGHDALWRLIGGAPSAEARIAYLRAVTSPRRTDVPALLEIAARGDPDVRQAVAAVLLKAIRGPSASSYRGRYGYAYGSNASGGLFGTPWSAELRKLVTLVGAAEPSLQSGLWHRTRSLYGTSRDGLVSELIGLGILPPPGAPLFIGGSTAKALVRLLRDAPPAASPERQALLKRIGPHLWKAASQVWGQERGELIKLLMDNDVPIPEANGDSYAVSRMIQGMLHEWQKLPQEGLQREIPRMRRMAALLWTAALAGYGASRLATLRWLLGLGIDLPDAALSKLSNHSMADLSAAMDGLPLAEQARLRPLRERLTLGLARAAMERLELEEARQWYQKLGLVARFQQDCARAGDQAMADKSYERAVALYQAANEKRKHREAAEAAGDAAMQADKPDVAVDYYQLAQNRSKLAAASQGARKRFQASADEAYRAQRYSEALELSLKAHDPRLERDREWLKPLLTAGNALETANRNAPAGGNLSSQWGMQQLARRLDYFKHIGPAIHRLVSLISITFGKLRTARGRQLVQLWLNRFNCIRSLLHRTTFRWKVKQSQIRNIDLVPTLYVKP